MERFTKQNIPEIRNDIDVALKVIADKHGVIIDLGRISFSDTEFRGKLTVSIANNGITNKEELEDQRLKDGFLRFGLMRGFEKSDLNKVFKMKNVEYEMLGLDSKKRKAQFIIKRARDGKRFKIDTDQAREALGREQLPGFNNR